MTNLQLAEKIELALNMLRTGKRILANDVLTDVVSELKSGEIEITSNVTNVTCRTDKLNETKSIILELFREDYLQVGECEFCNGSDCPSCHGTGYEVREGGFYE